MNKVFPDPSDVVLLCDSCRTAEAGSAAPNQRRARRREETEAVGCRDSGAVKLHVQW